MLLMKSLLLIGGGRCLRRCPKSERKASTVSFLGSWCLWLTRNKAVFVGVNPSLCFVKSLFLNELSCWDRAGAMQLASFGLPAIMSRV
jgi:hypothetical protein